MRILPLLIGLLYSLTLSAQSVSKFIVFGDSLSDTGNAYEYSHHSKPPAAIYYHGRYSDGPIWIDYVLNTLFPQSSKDMLLNYAFGGAGVLQSQGQAFTLSQEIDSYLSTHSGRSDSANCFVIWIGANDYLLHPNGTQKNVEPIIVEMVRNLVRLQKQGAQQVIVFGLPDLGLSPFAKDLEVQSQLSHLIQMHNQSLKEKIRMLQTKFPHTQWYYVDVHQQLNRIVHSPKHYGFAHASERCIQPEFALPATKKSRRPNAPLDCHHYVFLDQVHPTTQVHKMIAQHFLKIFKQSSEPRA